MKLNSTPKTEYWSDPSWCGYLDRIGLDHSYYRRNWEWAQVAYGLDQLGVLDGNSRGLGIGVGKEPLIFFLATLAREIVATDMYRAGWAKSGQADPSMLTEPEKISPIPYPRERLRVMRMDALDLKFPEGSFDFSWSVGAIEHFGSSRVSNAFHFGCHFLGLRKADSKFDHHEATRAIREIRRILRPGGVAAITTELVLNERPHHEFFLPEELHRFIIEPSEMELVGGDPDLSPCPFFMDRILPRGKWKSKELPHVILRDWNGVEFTSVSLFFRKPE